MTKLFQTVTDLESGADLIRKRPYGVIEVVDKKLVGIHFRPWPKLISAVEAVWIGGWKHKRDHKNRCLLYYNQPMAHRNFLVLAYVHSTLGTSYATFLRSTQLLEHVAMIKGSDALMCEITNKRLTDRFMERQGWERHMEHSKKRHWIKRFYGDFQSVAKRAEKKSTSPTVERAKQSTPR